MMPNVILMMIHVELLLSVTHVVKIPVLKSTLMNTDGVLKTMTGVVLRIHAKLIINFFSV